MRSGSARGRPTPWEVPTRRTLLPRCASPSAAARAAPRPPFSAAWSTMSDASSFRRHGSSQPRKPTRRSVTRLCWSGSGRCARNAAATRRAAVAPGRYTRSPKWKCPGTSTPTSAAAASARSCVRGSSTISRASRVISWTSGSGTPRTPGRVIPTSPRQCTMMPIWPNSAYRSTSVCTVRSSRCPISTCVKSPANTSVMFVVEVPCVNELGISAPRSGDQKLTQTGPSRSTVAHRRRWRWVSRPWTWTWSCRDPPRWWSTWWSGEPPQPCLPRCGARR